MSPLCRLVLHGAFRYPPSILAVFSLLCSASFCFASFFFHLGPLFSWVLFSEGFFCLATIYLPICALFTPSRRPCVQRFLMSFLRGPSLRPLPVAYLQGPSPHTAHPGTFERAHFFTYFSFLAPPPFSRNASRFRVALLRTIHLLSVLRKAVYPSHYDLAVNTSDMRLPPPSRPSSIEDLF